MHPRFAANAIKAVACVLPWALLSTSVVANTALPANRHIHTTGYGEVRVKPDTVVIQLQVSVTEQTGAAAKKEVDQRVNRFLDAAGRGDIDKEHMNAGELQINPRWEYRNQERVFTGYQASRNINVRLTELERLSEILDMALENGISNIVQLSYEHSDADKLTQQAHEKAVQNSKAKAESLAAAYGGRLGFVYSIDYQRANITLPSPVAQEAQMARASFAADSAGVYLQEEIVFSDSIKVVFDLTFSD